MCKISFKFQLMNATRFGLGETLREHIPVALALTTCCVTEANAGWRG